MREERGGKREESRKGRRGLQDPAPGSGRPPPHNQAGAALGGRRVSGRRIRRDAGVAELADARGLGPRGRKAVQVRPLSPAVRRCSACEA